MYNSDGYILIDLTGVDITKTNQYLKGIFNRVISVIDTNKLALVINAGDLTPMAAIVRKKLNYYVITTNLYIFTINTNDIIVIEEAGEATVDVSIVPTLLSGVKVADFAIGATEGSIYVPEQETEINDNTTSDYTTWSSDKLSSDLALKADLSSLAPVATTGDYDDLTNKPTIPTKTSDLTNDSDFITSAQVPTIDDTTVASDKVWSSYKTTVALATKQNSTDISLDTTDKTIIGAINELHAINGYSYDAYDDTATYSVGDLCIYNNTLYKCTTAITTAEAWNVSHWTATSIADEINELNTGKANASDLTYLISKLDNITITHYNCESNGGLLTLPSYEDFCLIFISRGEGGLYMGHWSGVTPIVAAANHQVIYYSNPSRINVTNNSSATDRVTVIRK